MGKQQFFFVMKSPRPAWFGMMQMLHDGPYIGKSSIEFLPMIDLDPCDPSFNIHFCSEPSSVVSCIYYNSGPHI